MVEEADAIVGGACGVEGVIGEDVKVLGLREGDVVRVVFESEIQSIDDEHEEDGPMLTFVRSGASFWPSDMDAIELVLPVLPEGWEYTPTESPDELARVWRPGSTYHVCIYVSGQLTGGGEPIPALVAKALLKLWDRTLGCG